jgi:hypothetical protein
MFCMKPTILANLRSSGAELDGNHGVVLRASVCVYSCIHIFYDGALPYANKPITQINSVNQ